jgi:hypothetical protein
MHSSIQQQNGTCSDRTSVVQGRFESHRGRGTKVPASNNKHKHGRPTQQGSAEGCWGRNPAEHQQLSNETQAEAKANCQKPEHTINFPHCQDGGTVRYEPHVLRTKDPSPDPRHSKAWTEATGCSPKGTREDQQRPLWSDFLEPSKLGKLNATRRP